MCVLHQQQLFVALGLAQHRPILSRRGEHDRLAVLLECRRRPSSDPAHQKAAHPRSHQLDRAAEDAARSHISNATRGCRR
jgi:hypothetical protein